MGIRTRIGKRTVALVAGVAMGGMLASAAWAGDGAALYDKSCTSCHGPGGKGDGPAGKRLKEPPADFAVALKKSNAEEITKIIKLGGKAVGKSPIMPAYGSKLSDDEVKALVEHVQGLAK